MMDFQIVLSICYVPDPAFVRSREVRVSNLLGISSSGRRRLHR